MRLPSVVSPRVLGVRGKRLSEWSVWQLLPTNKNLLSCSGKVMGFITSSAVLHNVENEFSLLKVCRCTAVHAAVTMLTTWPEVTNTDLIRSGRWKTAESTTCGTNFH